MGVPNRYSLINIFIFLITSFSIFAQTTSEENLLTKSNSSPQAYDFSDFFKKLETTRNDLQSEIRQKKLELQELIEQTDILENMIDSNEYYVGPGDIFLFEVWGAIEIQYPVNVTPEGLIVIPSVGMFFVKGKTISELREEVLNAAKSVYEKCVTSFCLASPRLVRVHVTGEVEFPGTYVGFAFNRISDLIYLAGGTTKSAWKDSVLIKVANSPEKYFNLSNFETTGDLTNNYFVSGGDVIIVPAVLQCKNLVVVEGDLEKAGNYSITLQETLLHFLGRNRLADKSLEINRIIVIRKENNVLHYIKPFDKVKSSGTDFLLLHGDRIILPSSFVYVKGAVLHPGAYPYSNNLTARDYAGMAGGDYRSGNINNVQVLHVATGKTESGGEVFIEPGDVVHMHPTWSIRWQSLIELIPTFTSLILAAKAAKIFD